MRTTEPCPAACATPTWSKCDAGQFTNNSPDYPTLLWKSDQVWFVADDAGLLTVVRINEPWTDPCSTNHYAFSAGNKAFAPRAAFDSSGRIHIVYDDQNGPLIRHVTFDTNTLTWSSVHDIGPSVWGSAGSTCTDGTGSCSDVTLAGFASNCLKTRSFPDIAIDKTANPNTIVVTYNTQGSGSCNIYQEQRWYRSTGAGTAWTWQVVTGCKTSVHTGVRHYSDSGVAGLTGHFTARSSYRPTNTGSLQEVKWKTTDGGLTYAAGFGFTHFRTVTGPIPANPASCWWGDYEGIAADTAHSSFVYSWASNQNPGPDWVIRARALDE